MPCDADVDPGAGRHLAVHHQALPIELVEMVPVRPVRHEVGVGDQHARRVGMGAEDADRLARLHQQRLVVLERAAARRRCGRSSPSRARRGRCRHRRRVRPASRRPSGRDCSSACAAALRSASSWPMSSVPVAARMTRALSMRVWCGHECLRRRRCCHAGAPSAIAVSRISVSVRAHRRGDSRGRRRQASSPASPVPSGSRM